MPESKRPRDLSAEATQRAIVETASRLFLEDGYGATSITRIAREAGVAVQTIYNSVGAKRELDPDDRVYVGAWTRLVVRPATEDEQG